MVPVRSAPRPGRRRMLVGTGLVAAVGVVWASVRPQASLMVSNRLTEAIALTLEDTGVTIPAGDSLRLALRAGRAFEAHWALVRPTAPDGRVLGEEMEGTIADDDPRGELREIVGVGGGDGPRRFTPVVMNETDRPLRAMVIAGHDTADCGCALAPGDSVRLGYYDLAPGTFVRVLDAVGAAGRFDPILVGVDSLSGLTAIRVSPRSLVAPAPVIPPVRAARPRPASGPRSTRIPR